MRVIGSRSLRTALLTGVAIAAVLAVAPVQARVGVTSQTTNNPLGTPPQQQQRTLKVGVDVFANERIQTAANDRAHLLFLDGSSLTVGPNSDLMIDKFVYDPNAGTGELAVSATKGIFRLVGGKITKTNEATIKVGTSTIGIRGGITIVNAPDCPPGATSADCQAQAYFMFGQQLSVTNPDGTQTATRPGSLIAFGSGGPPSPPVIAPPNSLAGPIAQLEAPAGTGNTGPGGPIDQQTANSNLPSNNSGQPPDPTNGAPQAAKTANNTTGAGSALGSTPDPNAPPPNQPPANHEPPPPPPPPPTVTISSEGRFVRQSEFASATFSAFSVEAPRDTTNNAYLGSATVTDGRLTATSVNGYSANLPWMPGNEFNITDGVASDGGATLTGRGFVTSDEQYFYFYRVRESGEGNRRNIIFGGIQTPASEILTGGFRAYDISTLDPNEAPFLSLNATSIPVVGSAIQGDIYAAHAPLVPSEGSNVRATWFQATLNIQGQGEAQSSYLSIATGIFGSDETKANMPYAAGSQQAFIRESAFGGSTKYSTDLATAETQNGTAIYGPSGAYFVLVPERVVVEAGSTVRTPSVGAALPFDTLEITDINYPVARAGAINPPADLGTVRTTEQLNGFVGALVENNNGGGMSSYAVYNTTPGQVTLIKNAATNRANAVFSLTTGTSGNNIQLQWGSLTDAEGTQNTSFIDDKRIAMRQSAAPGIYDGDPIVTQMSMVTASAVALPTSILPAGVSFCTCEYLTWGYWQGDLNYVEGTRAGQRDYVTLGTWVTGKLSAEVDLPVTGSATYTGHIIGNVENALGNSYVAVGGFSNTWDFGSREGSVAISNFDGANYVGSTSGSPGNVNFNGSFSGTGAATARSGQLWGAHFNAPGAGGNAAYQAGSFRLSSTADGYKAAGTFAAQRGPIGPPIIVTIAP